MSEKISVIIPVFNVENYIRESLDSLLNQTYSNWEAIVVDDGSTDSSPKILSEYANQDQRIVVIRQENSGVSSARNTALRKLTGDYVLFLDPDDFIHPQLIEIALSSLKKHNTPLIVFGAQKFYRNTKVAQSKVELDQSAFRDIGKIDFFSLMFNEQHHSKYCKGGYVYTKLYKKELLTDCFFDDKLSYYEDEAYSNQIYNKLDSNFRTVYLDYPLYFYRQRASSAIRANRIRRLFAQYSCRKSILRQHNPNTEEYRTIDHARLVCLIKLMQISLLSGYSGAFSLFRKILLSRKDIPLRTLLPYLTGPVFATFYSKRRLKKASEKNKNLKYWA